MWLIFGTLEVVKNINYIKFLKCFYSHWLWGHMCQTAPTPPGCRKWCCWMFCIDISFTEKKHCFCDIFKILISDGSMTLPSFYLGLSQAKQFILNAVKKLSERFSQFWCSRALGKLFFWVWTAITQLRIGPDSWDRCLVMRILNLSWKLFYHTCEQNG